MKHTMLVLGAVTFLWMSGGVAEAKGVPGSSAPSMTVLPLPTVEQQSGAASPSTTHKDPAGLVVTKELDKSGPLANAMSASAKSPSKQGLTDGKPKTLPTAGK